MTSPMVDAAAAAVATAATRGRPRSMAIHSSTAAAAVAGVAAVVGLTVALKGSQDDWSFKHIIAVLGGIHALKAEVRDVSVA